MAKPVHTQAIVRFLSHLLLNNPGQATGYQYTYDVDGAPWIDMVIAQDSPPGHLASILAREQAAAAPLVVQSGPDSETLQPHVQSIRFAASEDDMVGMVAVSYLDSAGTPVSSIGYRIVLSPAELSAHQAFEDSLRTSIPIDIAGTLQASRDRALMDAHGIHRWHDGQTGEHKGFLLVRGVDTVTIHATVQEAVHHANHGQ